MKKNKVKKSKIDKRSKKATRSSSPMPYKIIFGVLAVICLILSILLFDGYIELMADDADYLMSPYSFVTSGKFPTAHGAILYNLVNSIPTAFMGISITAVKLLNIVWTLLGLFFSYRLFRLFKSDLVLITVLFIQATSFAILYYASSILSEGFFMMIQASFIYVLYRHHDSLLLPISSKGDLITYAKRNWVVLLVLFLLTISKEVSVAIVFALVTYLICHKKFKQAALMIAGYAILRTVYKVVLQLFFGDSAVYKGRFSKIFYKNSYDPSQGKDDMWGLVGRLWSNTDYHVSCDFLRIMGWRGETIGTNTIPLISLVFVIFFAIALAYAYRNRMKVLYIGLHVGFLLGAIFIAVQTHWKQDRMIIIVIPLLLFFMLTVLHHWYTHRRYPKTLLYGACILLALVQLRHLPSKIQSNSAPLSAYLSGNDVYRYTPDWQNYIKAVQWSRDNLGEGDKLACRKPNTSLVYGNAKLNVRGLFKSTRKNADDVLAELKESGVTHILLANLRLNPAQAVKGQVIGTVHTYVRAIQSKYPEKLKVLKQFGDSTEPAYIIKIDY